MIALAALDDVLRALADPTRRTVYERIVGAAEINVGDLTQASGVTQGAVSQHLQALKRAGLVVEERRGRHVFYRATPAGLVPLSDWLRHYDASWRERFGALRALLEEIDR